MDEPSLPPRARLGDPDLGVDEEIRSLVVSPGERTLAVRTRKRVYLLELDSGAARWWSERGRTSGDPVFSPDGSRVAYAQDEEVRVVRAADGAALWRDRRPGPPSPVAFTREGRGLLLSLPGGGLSHVDLEGEREDRPLLLPGGTARTLTWHPDGRRLFLGRRALSCWDLRSGRSWSRPLPAPLSSLAVSARGDQVFAAAQTLDGTERHHLLAFGVDGQPSWSQETPGDCPELGSTPDGSGLLVPRRAGDAPGELAILSPATGEELRRVPAPPFGAAGVTRPARPPLSVSPRGDRVLVRLIHDRLEVDLTSGRSRRVRVGFLRALTFLRDGTALEAWACGTGIAVRDVHTGRVLAVASPPTPDGVEAVVPELRGGELVVGSVITDHHLPAAALDGAAVGPRLAMVDLEGGLWVAEPGAEPRRLAAPTSPDGRASWWGREVCLAFSPDGTLLASSIPGAPPRVHEVATGRLVATLDAVDAALVTATLAPDGRTLIALAGRAGLWALDVEDARPPRCLARDLGPDASFALGPTGDRVSVLDPGATRLRTLALSDAAPLADGPAPEGSTRLLAARRRPALLVGAGLWRLDTDGTPDPGSRVGLELGEGGGTVAALDAGSLEVQGTRILRRDAEGRPLPPRAGVEPEPIRPELATLGDGDRFATSGAGDSEGPEVRDARSGRVLSRGDEAGLSRLCGGGSGTSLLAGRFVPREILHLPLGGGEVRRVDLAAEEGPCHLGDLDADLSGQRVGALLVDAERRTWLRLWEKPSLTPVLRCPAPGSSMPFLYVGDDDEVVTLSNVSRHGELVAYRLVDGVRFEETWSLRVHEYRHPPDWVLGQERGLLVLGDQRRERGGWTVRLAEGDAAPRVLTPVLDVEPTAAALERGTGRLAVGDEEGRVRLFDAEGRAVASWFDRPAMVWQVLFCPAAGTLVSTHAGGLCRIWDLPAGDA